MSDLSPARIAKLVQIARGTTVARAVAGAEPGGAVPVHAASTAVIEAMFLLAAVDGEIAEDEVQRLALGAEQILGASAEHSFEATIERMAAALAADGWDARLRVVAAALAGKPEAATAYKLAAGVAFVDDVVAHAESAALDALARALGIDEARSFELMREVQKELFG